MQSIPVGQAFQPDSGGGQAGKPDLHPAVCVYNLQAQCNPFCSLSFPSSVWERETRERRSKSRRRKGGVLGRGPPVPPPPCATPLAQGVTAPSSSAGLG